MIEAVLFDFDYTLADSYEGVVRCINHCFEQMGLEPADPEDIRQSFGLSLPATFTALTDSSDVAAQMRFKELFIAEANRTMLDYTHLLPHARDTIAALRAAGYKIAIVTTKPRQSVEQFCARENLHFDAIVAAEDVRRLKPDPDALLAAAKQLGTTVDRCLFVGDSAIDAIAANRARMRFAAVLSGVTPRSQFEPYHRTVIVRDLEALPEAVSAVA